MKISKFRSNRINQIFLPFFFFRFSNLAGSVPARVRITGIADPIRATQTFG